MLYHPKLPALSIDTIFRDGNVFSILLNPFQMCE